MNKVAEKPRARIIRRERPIIERPRLIEKLDACSSKTILLLAPAGYGKTTLARQWARTLSSVVWVTATPAHRDVTVLARDIAGSVDAIGGDCASFVNQYLKARDNPQRAAREIGGVLAKALESVRAQWLVIDDYHELVPAPEAEMLVEIVRAGTPRLRCLVASRIRPNWAALRRVVYGEIAEVSVDELTMDESESTLMIGRKDGPARDLIAQAQGWPAVLALAANIDFKEVPVRAMPAELHQYLAEELFLSVSPKVRDALIQLALTPSKSIELSREPGLLEALEMARDIGVVARDALSLHPLLQEFLYSKLRLEINGTARARAAVDKSVAAEEWEHALELISRFGLSDLTESVLIHAHRPLVRTGRSWTLAAFANQIRAAPAFPPASVDLIDAEAALQEGNATLACELASRAIRRLSESNPLRSRSEAVLAHSQFMIGHFENAAASFRRAEDSAHDDTDAGEAIYGQAMVAVDTGITDVSGLLEALHQRQDHSPLDLIRYSVLKNTHDRLHVGVRDVSALETSLHVLPNVEDPRARTTLLFNAAYAFGLRSDYDRALVLVEQLKEEIAQFGLDFVRPYCEAVSAQLKLGIRRFGESELHLRTLEQQLARRYSVFHDLNVRTLRARLLLQLGRIDEALDRLTTISEERTIPSMMAEFHATRAVAFAIAGDAAKAHAEGDLAHGVSSTIEVRVLCACARTVVEVRAGKKHAAADLVRLAFQLGTWDPLVTIFRAVPEIPAAAAEDRDVRAALAELYERSRDMTLARRSGLPIRLVRSPEETLSPREMEILGLMAQGQKNAQMARALFISESTVKVHVRHVLEKLGVRTRAEAVSKFQHLMSQR